MRIIALSQSNPLKASAEFVENSIEARARPITITRFRQNREAYIRITDDGDGIALDADAELIVINSGHCNFVNAARNKSLKFPYICRLFGKELVLQNFPGASAEQRLERFIELGLYTEENLR